MNLRQQSWIGEIGKHLFILLVLAAAFFPFYVMLVISGKDGAQFAANPTGLTLPFHWSNYAVAWEMVSGYIFNTIFVCVTAVVLTFFFSINAAYFFARYRMPGGTFSPPSTRVRRLLSLQSPSRACVSMW